MNTLNWGYPIDREKAARELEPRVTVCIAAECREVQDDNNSRIVVGVDWKISGALGSAETMVKVRLVDDRWRLLTAGDPDDIKAVIRLLVNQLSGLQEIDETNIGDAFESALNARMKQRINHFCQGELAMSYDELLDIGQTKLPPEIYRDLMTKIRAIKLRAQFILAGFDVSGSAYILKSDEKCEVAVKDAYAVIGEGEYLAQSALLNRAQTINKSLADTIFNVFEAKRLAEHVPSVGKVTSVLVLYPDGRDALVDKHGLKYLETAAKKFGPRSARGKVHLEDDWIGVIWPADDESKDVKSKAKG